MTSREFFFLVAHMRKTQREYFQTRDQKALRACKACERDVDAEIARVEHLLETGGT